MVERNGPPFVHPGCPRHFDPDFLPLALVTGVEELASDGALVGDADLGRGAAGGEA